MKDKKEPTAEEIKEQVEKGFINDWSDANPPDYGVSPKQKVVDLESYRNRRS